MKILLGIIIAISVYLAVMLSLALVCLIEIEDVLKTIKKQIRYYLTQDILNSSSSEKQQDQVDQLTN